MTTSVISLVLKFVPLARILLAKHIPSCYWNYIAVCLDANGVQAYGKGGSFQHLKPY